MKNDRSLAQPHDVLVALALLSRLPVQVQDWSRQARAVWAYPLVGVVLGGVASVAGLMALGLGLPAPLVALITLAVLIPLSGAMHEDGLADTADGFWGGWDAKQRLHIMKDSHIGTYGVVALCLSLATRWAALWILWDMGGSVAVPAILTSAILSRAVMPILMAGLPHARDMGLSHSVGQVGWSGAILGVALAMGLALALQGFVAIWAGFWAALVLFGIALMARSKIHGQTGDVLGASQQITEVTILICLLA